MKTIRISFPFRTVSFQQARTGKFGHYKTDYQKAFSKDVLAILMANKKELEQFALSFNKKIHVLTVDCKFFYSDFFTKKDKTISQKTIDWDNSPKMVMDSIFKYIGLNDSDIVEGNIVKWEGFKDEIIITLNILEINEFEEKLEE